MMPVMDLVLYVLFSYFTKFLIFHNSHFTKFYYSQHDLYEAALYTQHALRTYIDSEINHIRHFIKIPFINKGIEFIDLPSIFRDNNVISAIPSYFENTESPIICYKYNKPIRNTILNFYKLVSDLDIETSSPDS